MDSFRNIRDGGIQKVETAADRLALLPADGDIVEQLDTHSLYSYDGSTASWILISQPAVSDLVTSVFGRVGDISAESGDYSGDQITQDSTHRFVTDAEKTTWNAKQDALGFTPENVTNKATNLLSPNNTTYPTTLAVSNSIGVVSTAFVDMKEPNGFINRTDSTIAFDHATRTFSISPVSGSYGIYVASNKITITTTKTLIIPNTTGNYYIYIDSSGNLSYTTTFDATLIASLAYCAFIYWDSTGIGAERIVTFGDERHGITMDGKTHAYLHTTRGAAFGNGCGLINFTINAGDNSADAQFTASSGLIWDEDIQLDIPTQSQFPVLYRNGTGWKKKAADAFPLIYNGTAGYTGTRIAYNLNTAGSWSLAQIQNNKFMLIHVFATNDVSTPFICILGQAEYIDKASARAAALTELQLITGLPVTEFVAIGSIVYETSNAYLNIPKARVVTINSENYVDYRSQIVRLGVLG